jgi:DNA-binding NarL/FixJ family response regulator
MSSKINIMIAEDHQSVREGYVSLFKDIDEINVIGEAGTASRLLKLVRKNVPDIVITDIEMPEMNGLEMIKILGKEFPQVRIIFLTMYYSEFFVSQMLMNGGNACLSKSCNFSTLLEAIKSVHTHGYYFSSSVSQMMVSSYINEKKALSIAKQVSLTHRETEILKFICEGMKNKEIAEHVGIEVCTVDFHRQSIYKKTCSSSVVDLVKYAIKNGIIDVG